MEERACGVYDKKEIFCRESQGRGRAGGREGGRQQAGMLVSSQAYGD